jgi:hypothetical protein
MTVHSLGIGAIDLAPRQFTARAGYQRAKAREARVLGPLMANQLFACGACSAD